MLDITEQAKAFGFNDDCAFVEAFNRAINNDENKNEMGNGITTLIWDYIEADMHMDLKHDYEHNDITEAFSLLADVYMEAA